ncbi:MAG TPA: hypothetical protein H9742_01330 [Candidatus Acetatifactor stercoripullorum]|uniref:Uncharacterized protein n=1 Tax=Candidatus Acetatifactor stercoripullorum TaxID=2838414 RepID=A0A9D1R289_9FIRM|nr:hypothetical protein [Candidatus Acetatifactor stercoripullorum]
MFETKKTLIVVYKDELLMNQLKKMVETHDDNDESVVGTRDDSINIVSWTEKVWLGNKKAGNIQGKILFLGDIKGTDKLIPVIDEKFDDCGVKYGWAGNQAVLFADPKSLTDRKAYDDFLNKLSELPVPSFLKTMKENVVSTGTDPELEDAENPEVEVLAEDGKVVKPKTPKLFKAVQRAIESGTEVIGKVGNHVAMRSEELFRNKSLMKRQMLFYGVIHLYNNGLEKFMNR